MANGFADAGEVDISAKILRRYSVSAALGFGGFGDFERWTWGKIEVVDAVGANGRAGVMEGRCERGVLLTIGADELGVMSRGGKGLL